MIGIIPGTLIGIVRNPQSTGIEPVSEAWEAPNKTLQATDLAALNFPNGGLKLETRWKLKAITDCDSLDES